MREMNVKDSEEEWEIESCDRIHGESEKMYSFYSRSVVLERRKISLVSTCGIVWIDSRWLGILIWSDNDHRPSDEKRMDKIAGQL